MDRPWSKIHDSSIKLKNKLKYLKMNLTFLKIYFYTLQMRTPKAGWIRIFSGFDKKSWLVHLVHFKETSSLTR